MAKKKETEEEKEEQTLEKDAPAEEKDPELGQAEEIIAALEAQLAQANDRLLRTLAEYDNFKKRSAREKEELYFAAKSDVIGKLLPVFDNFDRAQLYTTAEDYAKGVDMIISSFHQTLEGMEIREIAKEGDPFDPVYHEAVLREEKEGVEENTVTEVLQKGYAIGEKVIRHAMVKVSG